jgi:putative peptidoglycan lipid II flippase
VTQITFVVMTALASDLGTGAVSAYTIAFSLLQIPLGVIGIPLSIVIMPSLARELAVGRTGHYLEILTRSLRILAFVMLPITALGMVLRFQVVELLLGYGRFDPGAVQLTADTLLLFLLGLTAHSVIGVLTRAFYARRDTRTPTVAAVLAVVVNTTLAIALVGSLGLPAIGLSIALAAWSEAAVLLVVLRRREGPAFDLGALGSWALRIATAAVVAGVVAWLALGGIQGLVPADEDLTGLSGKAAVLLHAVVATLAGAAAYTAVTLALGVRELRTIASILVDLIRRRGRS